jgi:hypothetical protein
MTISLASSFKVIILDDRNLLVISVELLKRIVFNPVQEKSLFVV